MADGVGQSGIFESERLGLFKSHDFEGTTEWLTDSNGRRTATVVGGEGHPTTLLVHGVLSQAGEWALIAGKLGRAVVIPDWPGCGLSDPASMRKIGPRRFGEQWLTSVIDALGIDQVDIVGSSAGGYMGLALALAHPERVRRLVQVGSLPGLTRGGPMIFRLFATPGLGPLILRQQPKDAEANRRQVFSKLVAHPERIPVDMLENDLAAGALPNAVESGTDFCRSLVSPVFGVRKHLMVAEDLPRLTVPTLYLWGLEDNFLRPDKIRHVLERASAIHFEIIAGAGHLLTLEEPDLVASSIVKFLDSDR